MKIVIPAWLNRLFHLPGEVCYFARCYMRGDRLAAVRTYADTGYPDDADVSMFVDATALCFARLLRVPQGEEYELDKMATDAARIAFGSRLPGFKHRDMARAMIVEARAIIERYGTGGCDGETRINEVGSLHDVS